MTEEEAKTKWCPYSRIVTVTNDDKHNVLNSTAFNRVVVDQIGEYYAPVGTKCFASDCMLGVDEHGEWLGHCGAVK